MQRPERAETHPPYGGLKQSARFFPSAPPMLGAEQRETENQNSETFSNFLRGSYLRSSVLLEAPHFVLRGLTSFNALHLVVSGLPIVVSSRVSERPLF